MDICEGEIQTVLQLLEAFRKAFGGSWGALGGLLGGSWGALGGLLGGSRGALGASWGILGASCRHLAVWEAILAPSLGDLGSKLGGLGGQVGTKLGPSWAKLGQVGAMLGPCWRYVAPKWGYVGAYCTFSGHLRATCTLKNQKKRHVTKTPQNTLFCNDFLSFLGLCWN